MATTNETSYLYVACYSQFDNLAHKPRGTECQDGTMKSVRLNEQTGEMTMVSSLSGLMNPAFIRSHPTRRNIIYVATESILESGDVVAVDIDHTTGTLREIGRQSAQGKSTCYMSISSDQRSMCYVNYWDSTIGVLPLGPAGELEPACHVQPPPAPVVAQSLADHLANRQSEPHAHAISLDPAYGRIAFVPDLGTDLVRQYLFDPSARTLAPAGKLPCAPPDAAPHGPRYLEFDPLCDAAYVVNELSSTVSVFRFDRAAARFLVEAGEPLDPAKCPAVLRFAATYSTRVSSPPSTKNTCGRIAIDPSGQYLLVSNRGDDTIATFRIERSADGATAPTLAPLAIVPTEGATPRHFQFAAAGRFVIAANQDTDSITSFFLNQETGALSFSGHRLAMGSPNFVCAPARDAMAGIVKSSSSTEL